MTWSIRDVLVDQYGVAQAGGQLQCFPDLDPHWVNFGSGWQSQEYGSQSDTYDNTGTATVPDLAEPSEINPSTTNLVVVRGDGAIFKGARPTGIPGPILLYDLLKDPTYVVLNWGLVKPGTAILPIAAIQGTQGAPGPAGGWPPYGLLSARPSPGSAGDKALYVATDVDGGSLYQVESGAWVQITSGVSGGPPSGAAGGDLAGTYPNPTVGHLGTISGANLTGLNASNLGTGTVPTARLPVGTNSTEGIVQADGTTTSITAGVISSIGAPPSGSAGGDLGGTYPNPNVSHLTHVTDGSLPASGIAAVNPSSLTGSGTVPTAGLPAATTGAQGAVVLATPSSDTTAGHAVQASDARLSDTRAPSGAAGGDLGGTYPNPQVAHLSHVTDASLADSGIAALSASKLTGSHTLPDGTLSTNVPLLNAADTFTAEVTVPDLKLSGLTGSTAAMRIVGANASGAPASGPHLLGDLALDQTGSLWVCTVAGTPGTWTQIGAAYTLPDATTGAIGGVELDQAPPSGHPVALTRAERNRPNGLAPIGTDGMRSSMQRDDRSGIAGATEDVRWVRSASNPLFGGANTGAAQEPNVIVEGTTLKMWYTKQAGSGTPRLDYATSTDGVSWTQHGDVLGGGASGYGGAVEHCSVTTIDGVYYCYFADANNGNLKRSTSTDGTTWTTPVTVIASNAVAWSLGWNNSYVWQEGYTWYMLVEGSNTAPLFLLTYATSSDGLTWTFPTGGFLASLQPGAGGATGGPWMMYPQKRYGLYHLWYHACALLNGTTPTDIYHATSPDLVTWTIVNGGSPVIARGGGFEGDQVADPCIVSFGGSSYLYYEGVINSASQFEIALTIFPGSIARLIDGSETWSILTDGASSLIFAAGDVVDVHTIA